LGFAAIASYDDVQAKLIISETRSPETSGGEIARQIEPKNRRSFAAKMRKMRRNIDCDCGSPWKFPFPRQVQRYMATTPDPRPVFCAFSVFLRPFQLRNSGLSRAGTHGIVSRCQPVSVQAEKKTAAKTIAAAQ